MALQKWISLNLKIGSQILGLEEQLWRFSNTALLFQVTSILPEWITLIGNWRWKITTSMKNQWADIGQHFAIFPDGEIVTGRSMETSPACIRG